MYVEYILSLGEHDTVSLMFRFISLSQMALALADRAIGAIVASAVADAAGLTYLRILVTKYYI